MNGLGNLIKEARRQAGVSQLYLAVELGYKDHTFVSKVESGSRIPSLRIVKRLGEVLQIPPYVLAERMMGALRS